MISNWIMWLYLIFNEKDTFNWFLRIQAKEMQWYVIMLPINELPIHLCSNFNILRSKIRLIWPLKVLLCLFYPISLGSILRLSDKMLYIFAAHSTSTQRPYLIFIVGTDCPVQSIASGTKHKSTRTS